jgi:uncharacterized membrane protein YeaQ/YmgE (transglycosylase-associated protein family)
MSYLFIVVIGAVAGLVAGQYLKGSEMGKGPDLAAGAVGAAVLVLLVRMVGPAAASGFAMSAILAIIGAIASLYVMRSYTKSKAVPVARARRR